MNTPAVKTISMFTSIIKKTYSLKVFLGFFILMGCNSSSVPEWKKKNRQLIKEYNLEEKKMLNGHGVSAIESSLKVGEVSTIDHMNTVQLYPGVSAKVFWSQGAMVSLLQLEPNSILSKEKLPNDRLLVVLKGSIELLVENKTKELKGVERDEPDGTHSATPRTDFIFQQKNSISEVRAGDSGAQLMEIYNPVRLDYLEKLGISNVKENALTMNSDHKPTVMPNKVYDLYNIQLTEIGEDTFSRLVSTGNMQLSFASLKPNAKSKPHIHQQEQLTLVQRGALEQTVIGEEYSLKVNDVMFTPGNVVHSSRAGDIGVDLLDVFVPVRKDYIKKQNETLSKFHKIIPKDAQPELLIDGSVTEPHLYFSEGPKWVNGKVYFSNMYFDQEWNADPEKSSIVELSTDGSYHNISQGKMQANGLYPYKNGNLLVCDMIGHRVVEMTTSGKIVRVIVDSYEGKPIDGPNDIITDTKGGIYFTDPQFTMEAEKFQPGRAVYYVSNTGKIQRITEPNEFAMPNGILLSPDGKTLYINNCYDDESWYPVNSEKENFIWAYDVNEDGSISNGRKFAELMLTENVLDRKGKSSSADGMAIDKNGNIYVATYYGVQIFDAEGSFVGMINLPSFPVSLCFGDEDMKTLYIVSYDKVFKIRTNMEGYVNYL